MEREWANDTSAVKKISKEWLELRRRKFFHRRYCNPSFGNIEEEIDWCQEED